MSTNATVNKLMGVCDDLIGGSSLMWRYHHQVGAGGHAANSSRTVSYNIAMSYKILLNQRPTAAKVCMIGVLKQQPGTEHWTSS
jgi:fatty acid desaturase (delta-4 desaturase)